MAGFDNTKADIEAVKAEALRLLQGDIPSRERMTHLRAFTDGLRTRFERSELQQYLWQARRELAGAAEPVARGGRLKLEPTSWLWEGVLMAVRTTLVVALPKVGKSRLVTMALGRLQRGDPSFLGQPLPPAKPLILIVGSDQSQDDWQLCLVRAGLSDEDGNLDDCIVGLFHKGVPLHLDEAGIDQIVEYCSQYPGLVILVDCYSACVGSLGLEEKSDTYAGPLLDLQEAIAPYGATLILIHHSNRHSAGGRASSASRGTTALPAAVSQTVGLAWVTDPEENPLAPADYRIKLTTEGRAGKPLDLLIEQIDDGFDWKLHGSASDVARQKAIQDVVDGLKGRSEDALQEMVTHWQCTSRGMDAVHLAAALDLPDNRARELIESLLRKNLLQAAGTKAAAGGLGGKPRNLYRPVDAVLPFFPEVAVIPVKPVIDNDSPPKAITAKTGKTDAPQERECPECGTKFQANTRGRPKVYCSKQCKTKANRRTS